MLRTVTVTSAASAMLLLAGTQLAVAPLAQAMPTPCSSAGATQTKWSATKKPYKLIGWTSVTIPAHTTYEHSETLTRTGKVTGSVTSSAELSAGFKVAMLGKLEGKVGLQLQAIGEATTQISMTDTFTIAASSTQETYVFYKGVRHAKGNWKWRKCITMKDEGTFWTAWKKGKAGSWDGERKGAIDCSVEQSAGSIQALARSVGC